MSTATARVVGGAFILAALCFLPAGGNSRTDLALENAALAWERGDYIVALTAYRDLLAANPTDDAVERIALQTGELFRTTEITADGIAPRISSDGRHVTYEKGSGPARVTYLVELAADASVQRVQELRGYGATFSPDGSRLAYMAPPAPRTEATASRVPDGATPAVSASGSVTLNTRSPAGAIIRVRELRSGREADVTTGEPVTSPLIFSPHNRLFFAASDRTAGSPQQIYSGMEGRPPAAITTGPGDKSPVLVNASGSALVIATRQTGDASLAADGSIGSAYSWLSVGDGRTVPLNTAEHPAFSADGKWLAFVTRTGAQYRLMVCAADDPEKAVSVRSGTERLGLPALSPDGARVAFQMMAGDDWEIHIASRDGTGEQRVTREIQHDVLPRFLGDDRLLSMIGEPRHRRSYIYDLAAGTRTRLFHNNTVRTIAPEYSWTPTADGTKLLISADRDGDTVSPARGVYVVDLTRRVTTEELRARVALSLERERTLEANGRRLFAPITSQVQAVVADASVARIYGYEKALFDFGSKHITRPGNKLAAAYLFDTYQSFGYQPELQWFDLRTALDGRTANVIATLKGTVHPEVVYVVSSHYDSSAAGPGADDDSSGTAALLETARLLAAHPQPATIIFASFTGEEAGLLGSREFVRQALASRLAIAGALNNDMVGWTNDGRLDNTIRYSNPGIRDVQHAAAMQFSNMITYDTLYYRNTDAAAYYEAYGDIVGGIGSYPVLGNPHYHQPHDVLETINHQLVTEVARTTAASVMLLASSPSRLTGLAVERLPGTGAAVSWTASPERDVTGYVVTYGRPGKPDTHTRVAAPAAVLQDVHTGTVVSVRAVNARGLEGWDWARVAVR